MNCLSSSELQRYHGDQLSPDERDRWAEHIATCPECRARDAALQQQHDDLIGHLRSAGRPPSSARRPRPNPPPQLPGYEVRGEINRGGQGIVYRAWQHSTQREVAIKVLRDGLDAGPRAERRFEREVELVASLRHPGVVQIFDSGYTEDGRRYIVMDCVEGLPLNRYVTQHDCDLRTRVELFISLCEAVHHAHQRGVIHRDLKPSNILVRSDGQPCVLDFGLARHLTESGDRRQTLTGHVAGTLAYLSPEQARGLPDAIDVRSDVYTLGVLLFELVCGASPYDVQRDTVEVLQAIAEETPGGPLRLAGRDGVAEGRAPADLETILLTALAKDRDRRYQTAEALASDLRSFLGGEAIAARRDSGWYLLKMLVRRYRTIVGLGAALLVVSFLSAVSLGWLYAEQKLQRERAESAQVTADDRFQRLRTLARRFIFELDPKLQHVPGTAEARDFIVSTSLEYLDGLAAEAPDDHQLRYELARGYARVAEVLGDMNSSTVDDLPGALEKLAVAESLTNKLIEERPDDPSPLTLLQRICNQQGDNYANQRRYEDAVVAYERALKLAMQLDEGVPEAERDVEMLANTYERIGNVRFRAGQIEEAGAAYQQSMHFGQLHSARNPEDPWAARGVGVSHTKLARIALRQGDPETALEHYRAFRAGAERLAATHPNHRVAQHDLAAAEEWHCILLTQLNRVEEALPHCHRSVELTNALLEREPDSRDMREALAGKLTKLCEAQVQAERLPQAGATADRLLEVAESLVRDSSQRGAALRTLGVAQYKQFEVHKHLALQRGRDKQDQLASWTAAEAALKSCSATFARAEQEGVLAEGDKATRSRLEMELQLLQMSRPN